MKIASVDAAIGRINQLIYHLNELYPVNLPVQEIVIVVRRDDSAVALEQSAPQTLGRTERRAH